MLVFKNIFKFNVSFKIFFLILFLFFAINFILLYNLKFIGYVQNTVPILKSKQTAQKNEEKIQDSFKNGANERKVECVVSNITTLRYKKILQLRSELGDFYSKTPNSVELSKRYNQFTRTLSQNNLKEETTVEKYFTSGRLIKELKNATLLKASNAKKGSQLKILLHLPNNVTAIFKPKWYPAHEIINGSVYAGKDRHFGEVVAFYLSVLLGFRRVPVAAIRKLNIKELLLVSDEVLLPTFISKNNYTCLFGVCAYCSPSDLLCTDGDILEGSAIVYASFSHKLKLSRHPWSRTYKCDKLSMWETDDNYCTYVRNSKFYSKKQNTALFFDLIDASIFDFLIDNGDRHHFEYVVSEIIPRLIFFDNGKSFGNPYVDHIDILAPLYQCCLIRNSTWNTLLHLRGGNLSYWLRRLLATDPDLVFNEKHFEAIDRRLLLIFAVIKDCFKKKGMQNVILNY